MTTCREDAFYDRLRRLFLEDTIGAAGEGRLLLWDEESGPAGFRLGPYLIFELIGEGASSRVYRALHMELLRPLAVKVLREDGALPLDHARIRREGAIVAGLDHPGIVRIQDLGEVDGQIYIAMEIVEGPPLTQWLEREQPGFEGRLDLVRQLASALAHAHEHGVIHRDLKPDNVLVDENGRAVLVDFGLARREESMDLTATGSRLGTPRYMSPEQVAGESSTLGPQSDVFSLGVMAYEILTGRPPHGGESLKEIYRSIQEKKPPSPRRETPEISRDLEAVILRCLEKDPRQRYPDAGALLRDLDRVLRGEMPRARSGGLLTRGARNARMVLKQHAWPLVACLMLAAGLTWGFLGGDGDEEHLRRLLSQETAYRELGQRLAGVLDRAETARRGGTIEPRLRLALLKEASERFQEEGFDPSVKIGFEAWLRFLLRDPGAETLLRRALDDDPGNPYLHLFEVRRELYLCAEAVRWPRFMARPFAGAAALHFTSGVSGAEREAVARARAVLDRAGEAFQSEASGLGLRWIEDLVRAYEAYAAGDFAGATDLLERVGKRADLPLEAHLLATVAWARQRAFDPAVAWAEDLLERRRHSPLARANLYQALRVRALARMAEGRDARDDLRRAREVVKGVPPPGGSLASLDFAEALAALGRGESPGDALRRAAAGYRELALRTGEAAHWFNAGAALHELGKLGAEPGPILRKALDAFRKAEAARPTNAIFRAARINCELEVWGLSGGPPSPDEWKRLAEDIRKVEEEWSDEDECLFLRVREKVIRGDVAQAAGKNPMPSYLAALDALSSRGESTAPLSPDLRFLRISVLIKVGRRNPSHARFREALPDLVRETVEGVQRWPRFSRMLDVVAGGLARITEASNPADPDTLETARASVAACAAAASRLGRSLPRLQTWARAATRLAWIERDEASFGEAERLWKLLSSEHPDSPEGPLGRFDLEAARLALGGDLERPEIADLEAILEEARARDGDDSWVLLASVRLALMRGDEVEARRILKLLEGRREENRALARAIAALKRALKREP